MRTLLVSIFFLMQIASADTLQFEDFVGDWCHRGSPPSLKGKLMYWLSDDPNQGTKLTIENSRVLFYRNLDEDGDGLPWAESDQIEIFDDLFVAHLSKGSNDHYKLVLAGWKLESGSRMIFGFVYIYSKDGLFNGWPVTFVPCNAT